MARIVFGMNVSLDGYVDHDRFAPDPMLFRHFVEEARGQAGSLYGHTMYGIMRYWDEEQDGWDEDERAFAAAWRAQPKWVVAHDRPDLGPNATWVDGDVAEAVRALKAGPDGEIEVAGPQLAGALTELGLIDEYRLYLHPVVLGSGARYFIGARPPLRLVSHEEIGTALRLAYVPA